MPFGGVMLRLRIDKQITLPTTQTDSGKFIYIHQFEAFVSLLGSVLSQREGREPGRGAQTVMTEETVKGPRGRH